MPAEWLPALAKAASSEGLLKAIYGDLAKPLWLRLGRLSHDYRVREHYPVAYPAP